MKSFVSFSSTGTVDPMMDVKIKELEVGDCMSFGQQPRATRWLVCGMEEDRGSARIKLLLFSGNDVWSHPFLGTTTIVLIHRKQR